MEVQSVINESALKEARKYLIKPGIRKISAIASAAFVLLAQVLVCWQKDRYDAAGSICNCHFLWGIKNDREQTD